MPGAQPDTNAIFNLHRRQPHLVAHPNCPIGFHSKAYARGVEIFAPNAMHPRGLGEAGSRTTKWPPDQSPAAIAIQISLHQWHRICHDSNGVCRQPIPCLRLARPLPSRSDGQGADGELPASRSPRHPWPAWMVREPSKACPCPERTQAC